MNAQPCYLRLGGDTLDEAEYFGSVSAATRRFESVARDLDRFGQAIEGSLHYVEHADGDVDEYPDLLLSLGPRGGLRRERT